MKGGNGDEAKGICATCGKRKGPTISGSITSWIYKESCCTCDQNPNELLYEEKFVTNTDSTAKLPDEKNDDESTGNIQRIGQRYEIVEKLGQGGSATLYKVRDLSLQQFFAIKIIRPDLAVDANNLKRFQLEARAARELNHANIATVYAFNVSPEGIPYLIMDYVEGLHLGDFIAKGRLSMPLFYEIFNQILSALAHAHSRGVIHRDIKPSNILISELSTNHVWVKIVDFGIAKLTMPTDDQTQILTKTGEFIGSPTYISPEQALGEDIQAPADIYSLACVMYEFLAGRPPFLASNPFKLFAKHSNEAPPSLIELSKNRCSIELERVIFKCLEKDPADRYQNAFDLRSDLEQLAAGKEPNFVFGSSGRQSENSDSMSTFFDFKKQDGLYKLNTLFEGSLSFNMRINNILERILELACPGDSLLKLESKNPDFSGVIVIREGYQVLGANILNEPTSGYDALRRLITMADGNFCYSKITAQEYDLPELSLNLNLMFIIYAYPSLPESLSELLDQSNLRELVAAVELNEVTDESSKEDKDNSNTASSDSKNDEDSWMKVPAEKKKNSHESEFQDNSKLTDLTHKVKPKKDKSNKTKDYRSFKRKLSNGNKRGIVILILIMISLVWSIFAYLSN